MKKEKQNIALNSAAAHIPILSIRFMTDEEWNRIAYQQWLARQERKNVRA